MKTEVKIEVNEKSAEATMARGDYAVVEHHGVCLLAQTAASHVCFISLRTGNRLFDPQMVSDVDRVGLNEVKPYGKFRILPRVTITAE